MRHGLAGPCRRNRGWVSRPWRLLLLALAIVAAAWPSAAGPPAALAAEVSAAGEPSNVEIGIAYGTEKRHWLEWAVKEFAQSPEGRGIRVNLIPFGSMEAAHAILGGDEKINVWRRPAASTATRSSATGRPSTPAK